MVSMCLREQKQFGVVLIKSGKETRGPVNYHETGTLACIETFDQGKDGLLHIVARGTKLFKITKTAQQKDGLHIATINPVVSEIEKNKIDFSSLSTLLSEVLVTLSEIAPPKPWHLNDATWVTHKLAELMPLGNQDRLNILNSRSSDEKIVMITAHINKGAKSIS